MPDPLDDFFLRRFARARDGGDLPAALEVWKELVVRSYDRIAVQVRAFRFPNGQRLAAVHHDDATSEAFMRVLSMGANFHGSIGAQFRAALKRAVWFACMDYGRELLAYEQGIGGSLDERYEDSDDAGPYDATIERFLRAREQEQSDIDEDVELLARQRDLVAWGISQIANENYRTVLELTLLEGLSGDEIAERLDITPDNVYQRRKRGLTKLEEILRDQRP